MQSVNESKGKENDVQQKTLALASPPLNMIRYSDSQTSWCPWKLDSYRFLEKRRKPLNPHVSCTFLSLVQISDLVPDDVLIPGKSKVAWIIDQLIFQTVLYVVMETKKHLRFKKANTLGHIFQFEKNLNWFTFYSNACINLTSAFREALDKIQFVGGPNPDGNESSCLGLPMQLQGYWSAWLLPAAADQTNPGTPQWSPWRATWCNAFHLLLKYLCMCVYIAVYLCECVCVCVY